MNKVLNLYAGIGGNRKLWEDVEVTAIEIEPHIAQIYSDFFPADQVIVTDAHQYLLEHINDEWDFIWSSPPCPSHSRFVNINTRRNNKFTYPDMTLYQEIILLKSFSKCKWLVENVVSYYKPLMRCKLLGRHYFWSNFRITDMSEVKNCNEKRYEGNLFDLSKYSNVTKFKLIDNCVDPKIGLHIYNCAFKLKQLILEI